MVVGSEAVAAVGSGGGGGVESVEAVVVLWEEFAAVVLVERKARAGNAPVLSGRATIGVAIAPGRKALLKRTGSDIVSGERGR